MRTLSVFAIIGIIFLSTACSKNTINPKALLTSNPLETQTDKLVDEHIRPFISQNKHIGMSIAVIDGNETQYYHYGEKTKDSGKLPTNDSFYEIGSITKTFTAALTVDYFQNNNIDLNTPINDLLPNTIPELSKDGIKISIKHLLNHSSGLPRLPEDITQGWDEHNPYAHYRWEQVQNYLKSFTLSRTPGSKVEYSNFGFGLLGLLMEQHSGKSYEQLLKEHILEPLALGNTKIALSREDKEKLVSPYGPTGETGDHWDLADFKSAGALISNIVDVANYAKAQMNSYDGEKQAVFAKTKEQTATLNPATNIGLSWFVIKKEGNILYFHNGGTGGFTSFLIVDANSGKGVVTLSNNAFQQESEPASMRLFEAINK